MSIDITANKIHINNKMQMNKAKLIIFGWMMAAAVLPLLSSCSGDDAFDVKAKVQPAAIGSYVDQRDGYEYRWVRYGNLDWMAENARFDLKNEDLCHVYRGYEDQTGVTEHQYLPKYGRLYSYQGALDACPEGWRLPTDDDWQNLEQQMGMKTGESEAWDWRGQVAQRMMVLYGEPTYIDILLAGFKTDHVVMGSNGFLFNGVYAFFWTSSRDEGKEGEYYIYRKFAYSKTGIYRQSIEKLYNFMSVRYCRDAQ